MALPRGWEPSRSWAGVGSTMASGWRELGLELSPTSELGAEPRAVPAQLPGSSRALLEPQTLRKLGQAPASHRWGEARAGALSLGACLGEHVPTPAFQMFWAWILVPDQVGQSSSTAGELFQTVGYVLG